MKRCTFLFAMFRSAGTVIETLCRRGFKSHRRTFLTWRFPIAIFTWKTMHKKYLSGRIFIKLEKFLKICKDVMLTPRDTSKVFKQFNLGYTQCNEMRRFYLSIIFWPDINHWYEQFVVINKCCYYNHDDISLTHTFSSFTSMACIFGRVLASKSAILMPDITSKEYQKH